MFIQYFCEKSKFMENAVQIIGGKFLIQGATNITDIKDYRNGRFNCPITITFYPDGIVYEKQALELANSQRDIMISEAKAFIALHSEFYKNFHITFLRDFSEVSLTPHDTRSLPPKVNSLVMYPHYQLVEAEEFEAK